MKSLVLVTAILAMSATSADGRSFQSLPKPAEIFVIACHPGPKEFTPYFTPDSLLKALPEFRKGEAEIRVGAKRYWQSGVIVLKDKSILFWSTCRTNFIHIATADGTVSFIRGDGKDNF